MSGETGERKSDTGFGQAAIDTPFGVEGKNQGCPLFGPEENRWLFLCDYMVRKSDSGHRRPGRYVQGLRLSALPARKQRNCPGGRNKRKEPDRMAVRHGLLKAQMECQRHLYAGIA